MPVVPFETLPDAARVWIFGSDVPLSDAGSTALLSVVDEYLAAWKAHGQPLTVGSQLRDARFLVIAVDQSTAGATGCSIDGLFRILQQTGPTVGANLVGGGRVFYRGAESVVQSTTREQLAGLVAAGTITKDTVVFDTSITDLGTFRSGFEKRAKESWIAEMAGLGDKG